MGPQFRSPVETRHVGPALWAPSTSPHLSLAYLIWVDIKYELNSKHMRTRFSSGSRSSAWFGPFDDEEAMPRCQHGGEVPTIDRRHDGVTTTWRRCDDGATTVTSRGLTCHKPGFGAEPEFYDGRRAVVLVPLLHGCTVVFLPSCRRSVVDVPWRRLHRHIHPSVFSSYLTSVFWIC